MNVHKLFPWSSIATNGSVYNMVSFRFTIFLVQPFIEWKHFSNVNNKHFWMYFSTFNIVTLVGGLAAISVEFHGSFCNQVEKNSDLLFAGIMKSFIGFHGKFAISLN